ncbi:MAG: sulfatase-like hydrolase/transferase, partial [Polyangiaceae bacterium]|nr:sulfatase-like hydrolase/transferase [Polyangiaceae bacterium]
TVSVQGYWYFYFKGYGFERGWDLINHSAAPRVVRIEGDKSSNGEKIATELISELEKLQASGERFFAWGHWMDPHADYVAHEGMDFGSDSRARYDGEVAFTDAQLGRVFRALERLELKDSTVVMLTSDHGEAFGEHGMIRHGFELWEELVRVPLMIRVPGARPLRVDARRSLIDLAPTIADVFGLSEEQRGKMQGTSLFLDWGDEVEERPLLIDMPRGPNNRERRAFISDQKKLITSQGMVLGIYDLANDPLEKKDLSEDKVLRDELLGEMKRFLAHLKVKKARR